MASELAKLRARPPLPTLTADGELVNSWGEGNQRLGLGEYPATAAGNVRCRATLRDGWRCAAWGIDGHPYCRFHGAVYERATQLAERRYAEFLGTDETLLDRFRAFLLDPDISDVRPELALQRTLLADALDGIEAGDFGALSPNSVAAITQLNAVVAKLAAQCDEQQSRAPTSVTPTQLLWIVEQIVTAVSDAVRSHLPGDELADVRADICGDVADALEAIAVPDRRRGAPQRE